MTAATVADDFIGPRTGNDFARARSPLHADLCFEGPSESLSGADSYLASHQQLRGIVTGAEKQKVFTRAGDVRVVHDLRTARVSMWRACERHRLRDGMDRIVVGGVRCPPVHGNARRPAVPVRGPDR